jgi:ribosomal protein S18 acetylase RimI-like enzyme
MMIRAAGVGDITEVRRLFLEYAEWLAIDLSFQNFEEELARLPGDYSAPDGRLLVAEQEDRVAGCVALRPLDPETCEMKRLYIRPEYRGSGLGRQLVLAIMAEARAIGYKRIRLDTLPQMSAAQGLYESLGFREIEAYRFNPVPGTRFLEARL